MIASRHEELFVVREYGGPEVLKLEDVPDPKPGPIEVIVRLRAVGVNPVDVYIRTGAYARKPALPFMPGFGRRRRNRSGRRGRQDRSSRGDRVFIHGTAAEHTHGHYGGAYAEQAVCRLDHMLSVCRRRVSFAQGAAMGVPYATAYRALFHRARDAGPAKPCWCTARPAASASPPCRSRARTASRSSAPAAPTAD